MKGVNLRKHVANMHTSLVRPACEICNKTYSSPRNLRVHKATVHEKGLDQPPVSCGSPGCDKSYLTKAQVKKHFVRVHSENLVRFECKLCGKEFKVKQVLEQHIAIVTLLYYRQTPISCRDLPHDAANRFRISSSIPR